MIKQQQRTMTDIELTEITEGISKVIETEEVVLLGLQVELIT